MLIVATNHVRVWRMIPQVTFHGKAFVQFSSYFRHPKRNGAGAAVSIHLPHGVLAAAKQISFPSRVETNSFFPAADMPMKTG